MRRRSVLPAVLLLSGIACGPATDVSDAGARDAGAHDASVLRDAGAPSDAASDARAAAGPERCALVSSGPIVVDTAGALVENLRIDAVGEPAITVRASSVTIRNVLVTHRGAPGIVVSSADGVTLSDIAVEYLDAPAFGANPSADHVNVDVYASPRITIDGARLRHGSSGIYLVESPGSILRRIQGEDFRGPFPRGQLVQWDKSDDGLLEDFSVVSPSSSWPEDNVNVYQSSGVVVRRGLVDGNNSPSGVGVIFDGGDSVGRVEDVDAIRMGNGCFSSYGGGDGSVFLRTRCRENVCTDQGRGLPSSDALMWAGRLGLRALRVEESVYFAACNPENIVWPRESFAIVDLSEADFTPRSALAITFCWE